MNILPKKDEVNCIPRGIMFLKRSSKRSLSNRNQNNLHNMMESKAPNGSSRSPRWRCAMSREQSHVVDEAFDQLLVFVGLVLLDQLTLSANFFT